MPDTVVRRTGRHTRIRTIGGGKTHHFIAWGGSLYMVRQLVRFAVAEIVLLIIIAACGNYLFAKTVIGGTRSGGGTPRCVLLWCR